MKSMVLTEYGSTAEFQLAEIPRPAIKPGHVLVQVSATSVNPVDTMIRQMGTDLPFSPDLPAVLGMDFAGTVKEVGEGVSGFVRGDEVYGCAGGLAGLQGALANYMLADYRLIAHKPSSLSMREAAALPLVGITAFEGLQRAGIRADQKVLVHGGSGGVGHIAVQLARYFGADVSATVSGENQMDIVREYGAAPINYTLESVADYVEEHTGGAGFDVIFDSVGGANLSKSFEAAALNGQVSTTVSLLDLDLTPAHFKGLSLHVVFMLIPMLYEHNRQQHGVILARLAEIVDEGGLIPLVDRRRFTLNDVGKAHEMLTSGQAVGKVVIEI